MTKQAKVEADARKKERQIQNVKNARKKDVIKFQFLSNVWRTLYLEIARLFLCNALLS